MINIECKLRKSAAIIRHEDVHISHDTFNKIGKVTHDKTGLSQISPDIFHSNYCIYIRHTSQQLQYLRPVHFIVTAVFTSGTLHSNCRIYIWYIS